MYQNTRKRVFISYDFDNDKNVRYALEGQARRSDSPFEIIDWSLNEVAPERNWEQKARERIKRAQVVIVMCGYKTHLAQGVAKELTIARQEGKPYFLLGRDSSQNCTKPTTALPLDKVYQWTWDNLVKLLNGYR